MKVYVLAMFKNTASGRRPDAGDTEDLNPVDGVNLSTDQERALVLYLDPVEQLLHQERIIKAVIEKLVYAHQVELTIVGEPCLELGAVCLLQGLKLPVHAGKLSPPHSPLFSAGLCGYEVCQPGLPGVSNGIKQPFFIGKYQPFFIGKYQPLFTG